MDVDRFWELNEGLNTDSAVEELRDRLSELDPSEIASFQKHFGCFFASAYRWNLWGAAYIIDGGCSDDSFMDFRYGLISRGRSVFEAAISDPDTLVDVADDTGADFIPNENFGYVARQVYEVKTGQSMPDDDFKHPSDPTGQEWDFDDEQLCKRKLPKLWDRFGA